VKDIRYRIAGTYDTDATLTRRDHLYHRCLCYAHPGYGHEPDVL
jgi:hypothetical protein